jgi:hypothetical protein
LSILSVGTYEKKAAAFDEPHFPSDTFDMTLADIPVKQSRRKRRSKAKTPRKSEARSRKANATGRAIGRWVDELAAGLPELPPLPADFGRADIYDDHD